MRAAARAIPIVVVTVVVLAALIYYLQPRPVLRWFADASPDVLYFVDTDRRIVALTIDDGPHADVTPAILDVLERHDVRATWFLIGERVPGNEALVRRILDAGHELGNHLMADWPSRLLSHEQFVAELEQAHDVLSAFGPLRWFRPGSGWFDGRMVMEAERRGYRTCLGSLYPHDTKVPSARINAIYLERRVFPGGIIILHDGKPGRMRTVDTLERVLPALAERGYDVVTLSELAALEDGGAIEAP